MQRSFPLLRCRGNCPCLTYSGRCCDFQAFGSSRASYITIKPPRLDVQLSGAVYRRGSLFVSSSVPRRKASIQVDIDSRSWRPNVINDQNDAFLNFTSMEVSDRRVTRASSHQSVFCSVAYVGINRLCTSTNKCVLGETGIVAI